MPKEDKPKLMSTKRLYELADRYIAALSEEKKIVERKRTALDLVTKEMALRPDRSMTSKTTGTKITYVTPESVVYDEEGIWKGLEKKPKKRAEVFDEFYNLNGLPKETRDEVISFLVEKHGEDAVEEIRSRKLNIPNLSLAVQSGRITAKFLARFTTIESKAPYVKITAGTKPKPKKKS